MSRSLKRTLSSVLTLVLLAVVVFFLLHNARTGDSQVGSGDGNGTATPGGSGSIAAKLVQLTDAAKPGPTKDYYWENGSAKLQTSQFPKPGTVSFSGDAQGRAAVARGSLTYSMFAASRGGRQGTPLQPPTGWPEPNPKVAIDYSLTGRTYHGYFWNRSHSIADSLAGRQSYTSANNFTAGSRPQNVGADQNGGMRAAEEYAEGYWQQHASSRTVIYYQTTPVYVGNEAVPRGSIVDVKSSDGKLDREFVIINDAEGWRINYMTGEISAR